MDSDAVFLGGHQAGQQIAVTGHQHHVGAGPVPGQFGELGVHRGVDALLRPAPVTAGESAEPDGHPGHHTKSAVLGLRYAVGGAVEPVDPQQRLLRIGLCQLTQAPDEARVVDGDAGTGGLPGQQTRGCTSKWPASTRTTQRSTRSTLFQKFGCGLCQGFPSSLPDGAGVDGRNSIIGVAEPENGA